MCRETQREQISELLGSLIAIETENPPGNEGACAEFVVDWFEARGIESSLVLDPYEDRPQAVARVGDGSPTVVLNGHLDVVPAGDPAAWDHDPYAPVVDGDRMYGRGSTDMKAGLAIAMLTALHLQDELAKGELEGSIIVQAAVGEETADPGTKALLEAGYTGDYGIVLEPTEMRTATSEKGLAWYDIIVQGEASHASRPDQGSNAVRNAQPVLDAIAAYDEKIRERTDPLVGQAYATVTAFEAGVGSNRGVVPERARITLDRRILPSESIDDVDTEVEELLQQTEADHDIVTDWTRETTYESAEIPTDSHLAETFRTQSHEIADVAPEPFGIQVATDVRNFVNDADIEAITWGPGSIEQAHTRDEFVSLEAVTTGLEVLQRATRNLLQS